MSFFNGWGLFGGNTDLNAQIDSQVGTIKLVDQCIKYSSADMATTIKIATMQNPPTVKRTGAFSILIYDTNLKLIATTTEGLTFLPTAGSFTTVNMESLGSLDV
jgi:hypothetical protein